jgi:hypothetical protein
MGQTLVTRRAGDQLVLREHELGLGEHAPCDLDEEVDQRLQHELRDLVFRLMGNG